MSYEDENTKFALMELYKKSKNRKLEFYIKFNDMAEEETQFEGYRSDIIIDRNAIYFYDLAGNYFTDHINISIYFHLQIKRTYIPYKDIIYISQLNKIKHKQNCFWMLNVYKEFEAIALQQRYMF